jgi:hypothetical protein
VEGKIPSAVLKAFLPVPQTFLGQSLVPLTAGHDLVLAHMDHPLVTGQPLQDVDVLLALFIFSRSSRDLFAMIGEDTLEKTFFDFLSIIPPADIPRLGEAMVAHWVTARVTALAMESKHSTAQKKTAVSAGY